MRESKLVASGGDVVDEISCEIELIEQVLGMRQKSQLCNRIKGNWSEPSLCSSSLLGDA